MMKERDQGDQEDFLLMGFINRYELPFEDHRLLYRALTHRSFLNEHPEAVEDNERLEFLGDAVLDFLVGAWLYNHFPEMKEGELTRLRSALVKTDQLAEFSIKIGLNELMRLGHGETETGGRTRPVLLCATFEAFIGALYLKAGFQAVEKFVEPLLDASIIEIFADRRDQDPKSELQEWSQSQGFGTPLYRTVSTSGPEHEKTFVVEVIINHKILGVGEGHSKQAAAKEAAINALEAKNNIEVQL
jgi:ribonuclease III